MSQVKPPNASTVRLTMAQALVNWLVAQRSTLLDGTEVPMFAGVFAIGPRGTPHVSGPDRGGHGAGRRCVRAC
jgi:3D-(3,5/4)-trihydroxycyclohexane-1,2-dione acylhydrolase (decyclizing)